MLSASGEGRWQRATGPRARSASDAAALRLQTGVELAQAPESVEQQPRPPSRGSWGRLTEVEDGTLFDAPPPPAPRGAPLPLKINTDLRLVRARPGRGSAAVHRMHGGAPQPPCARAAACASLAARPGPVPARPPPHVVPPPRPRPRPQYRARLARMRANLAADNAERKRLLREAEASLRRCLATDPTDPRPYVSLGRILLRQKRYDEARKLYADGTANTGAAR